MPVSMSQAAKKKAYDFPIVTSALIGLNVAVFAAIAAAPSDEHAEIYRVYGLTAANPTLFSMFTSSFLHSDLLHLSTNMVFLWLFGRSLERAFSVVRYLMLYVCSGLFGAFTHLAIVWAFMPDAANQPSLGASGAIAGILGMYAIRFFRSKLRFLDIEIHPPVLLMVWLIFQIFLGLLSLYIDDPRLKSVDYWAHMGGFAFGMVVAYFANMARIGRREYLLTDVEDSLKRGTLLDVIRTYEALLRYDKKDPFTNAELGRTWALLGDDEQALPYYNAAITLYLQSGKGQDAAARYHELVRILPKTWLPADTLYRLSEYLEESGKPSKAIGILGKMCDESLCAADCQMAMLKMAQIQLHTIKKPQLAASTIQHFLDLYPASELRSAAEATLIEAEAATEQM